MYATTFISMKGGSSQHIRLHIYTCSLCAAYRYQGATSTDPEYEFVIQPNDEFYCPITKELLLDAHQTKCCGHILSAGATSRIQKEEGVCPVCKKAPLVTYPDKNFSRRVSGQYVFCSNKKRGCEWMGELSESHSHKKTCLRKEIPKETDREEPSQTQ